MTGVERIAAERQRQIEAEGYSPAHDAEHGDGSLIAAARCYAYAALCQTNSDMPTNVPSGDGWPWERTVVMSDFTRESVRDGWKPSDDPIRNLVKAGALIAAEVDRLLAASADTGHTSRHIHEECGHPWDSHRVVRGGCGFCSCKAHPPNQPNKLEAAERGLAGEGA